MRNDQDPPTTYYWIRVTGLVGKPFLGAVTGLDAAPAPASTILHIESDGGAAEIVASLHARGLKVLTISQVA